MKYVKKMPAHSANQFQRGASLLEAIAFLGIAAVVILGAVSLLGGAFGSSNINKTSTEIVTLKTNISKLFIGQSSYGTGDISSAIDSAKMAPGTLSWQTSTSNWKNAFNGTTSVSAYTTQYVVQYTNVTTDACIPIVMNQSGWNWIVVNPTSVETIPTAESATSHTYSPTGTARTLANVTNSCKGSNANTLAFYGS